MNRLHRQTNGAVALVIIQEKPQPSLGARLRRLRWRELPATLSYGFLLRLRRDARRALDYFRLRTTKDTETTWLPPTITVSTINSDDIYERLTELAPDLLVVWGSTILDQRIVHSAPHAINLHMGIAPQYRGAAANQYAVYKNDFTRLGATIHYINGYADAGDIIEQLFANITLPTQAMFTDLNDRAENEFLRICTALAHGQSVARQEQNVGIGENFKLKHWTPRLRYIVGTRLLARERAEQVSKE